MGGESSGSKHILDQSNGQRQISRIPCNKTVLKPEIQYAHLTKTVLKPEVHYGIQESAYEMRCLWRNFLYWGSIWTCEGLPGHKRMMNSLQMKKHKQSISTDRIIEEHSDPGRVQKPAKVTTAYLDQTQRGPSKNQSVLTGLDFL